MKPSFLLPTLLSAIVAASPGHAVRQEVSTKETRAIMHGYAKCVVDRRHRKASEALLANADNDTIMREYPMLIVDECLAKQTIRSVRMRFRGDLYRYALADALVQRELAAANAPDFSAVPRLDHRDPGEAPQRINAAGRTLSKKKYEAALEQHEMAVAFSYLSRYGECVVRNAPMEAKALLLTIPDSHEETARIGALRPALGTCLTEGKTLKFNRIVLRGTIAINYFRLARAAAGTPAE